MPPHPVISYLEIRTHAIPILQQALCPPSQLISPAPQLGNTATLRPDTVLFHLWIAYDTATELNLQILSKGSGVLSLRLL